MWLVVVRSILYHEIAGWAEGERSVLLTLDVQRSKEAAVDLAYTRKVSLDTRTLDTRDCDMWLAWFHLNVMAAAAGPVAFSLNQSRVTAVRCTTIRAAPDGRTDTRYNTSSPRFDSTPKDPCSLFNANDL